MTATSGSNTQTTVRNGEEDASTYREWAFDTASSLRLMILEINSSRQVLWHFLREIPPRNGSNARVAARAVHSKLARSEIDLLYAIDYVEDSLRAFGGAEVDGNDFEQSRSRNGQSSSSNNSSKALTLSKVKPFRIKVINFLDDEDYKEWTNLMMNAMRNNVRGIDASRHDLWRHSSSAHVQTAVKLLGRAEESVITSTGKIAAAYRAYVVKFRDAKPSTRRNMPAGPRGSRPRGRRNSLDSFFQTA